MVIAAKVSPGASATEQIVGQLPLSLDKNAYLRRLDAFTPKLLETPKWTLISLFCGGGGLDLGLGLAGFRTVVANDLAPVFVETVVANLPHAHGYSEDALSLTGAQLLKRGDIESVDLVAAGPPCQAFSILGRRGALDDARGKLTLKYFELVAELRPKAFVFENVPGLLTVNGGEDWKRLLDFAHTSTGYKVVWARLNAASFGIPQYRERVLIVGLRDEVPFEFPTGPTGPGGAELVAEGHLATPSAWALEYMHGLPNHKIREHGERVRNRYAALRPGDRDAIDHTDRINPSIPSGTVLVGSSEGGGRPHIHPYQDRVITVREAARLQSFPDWYTFHGTGTAQYRQIGNAVPPLLAYEIGRKIGESFQPKVSS